MINIENVNDKNLGYFISKLEKKDFELIKNIIKDHFNELINNFKVNDKNINFSNYLDKFDQSNHQILFTKKNRVLPKKYLDILIKKFELFKKLKKLFGDFEITDEENLGFGNFYWRLVRPFPNIDVGTMHKDKWFWDLGTGSMDEKNFTRYKLWISIIGEGKLGFRFVSGSPKLDLKYKTKIADGKKKPVFDESILKSKQITSLKGDAGTFIMFNDELLHGGEILNNKLPRVSIECTFKVKKN